VTKKDSAKMMALFIELDHLLEKEDKARRRPPIMANVNLRDVAGIRELTSLIKTDQLSFKSLRQNN
jgi:hypothetical protein